MRWFSQQSKSEPVLPKRFFPPTVVENAIKGKFLMHNWRWRLSLMGQAVNLPFWAQWGALPSSFAKERAFSHFRNPSF